MAEPLNRREAITNLQRYLRRLSFEGLEGERVPVDGIFDSATGNAVAEFQRTHGLPVTGVADKATWDAIFEEYMRVTDGERNTQGLYFFPDNPPDYAVSAGDTLMLVRIIQMLLLELRAAYDVFEDITESGTYDGATVEGVREFQKINGLPPTGEVDRATWNRIVREYSNIHQREQTSL